MRVIPALKSIAAVAALSVAGVPAFAVEDSAAGLRARHGELRDKLRDNAFSRPLTLSSTENDGKLRGDVHARLDHPYSRIRASLAKPASWCDLLVLPFNVQKCEARADGLTVSIGRKPDSPLADATRLDMRFAVTADSDELLQVELTSPTGPAGTRDYRIVFAATPLDEAHSFVHMAYGYTSGTMSRLAMQAYLSTAGADKVGFSSAGEGLVGGMRGVLERNTMRYFLAIDSYLATVGAPRRARLEHWFDATEKYPRQLHEMSRDRYVAIKEGKVSPG